MLTFELEIHFDNDNSIDVRPTHAKVEVTTLDVLTWQNWAEVIKANGLYKVEAWDYRCKFFNTDEDADEEGALVENTEFRAEACRVIVDDGGVCFEGYEKHGDSTTGWSTEEMVLDDLAKQLCE